MSNPNSNVRDMNSGRPFQQMAMAYLNAGWFPIPLKPRDKPPIESGYTGKKNPFPTDPKVRTEMVGDWLTRVDKFANIGVWLQDGVIGIDVDDYVDKGKVDDETGLPKIKTGMKTLRELEAKLGPLPPTWVSTARADGKSGIRMFRIPKGLAWPGKAGNDIDVIQHGHRFAVTYPSYHPEVGGTYQWYTPGEELGGSPERPLVPVQKTFRTTNGDTVERTVFEDPGDVVVPEVAWLPELPDSWVDYLTDNRIKASAKPIDMDSTGTEIEAWAKKSFRKGRVCSQVRKRLDNARATMKEDASSHDKILNAHFSILMCGVEGHAGVLRAAAAFEKSWERNVLKREKRDPETVRMELYRSRMGALRIAKGRVDAAAEEGIDLLASRCACFEAPSEPEDGAQLGPRPTGEATDPGEYRMNDDGNAQHLADLYRDSLIYVPGYGQWMFWSGERWIKDEDGLARRCFYRVRDRQEAYAQQLRSALDGVQDEDDLNAAKAKAKEWAQFARKSGSNVGARGALEAAQSLEGISVSAELMDQNPRLLGVNNGVLELTKDGPAVFRKAKHDDYVTVNTDVDFYDGGHTELLQRGGDLGNGVRLWGQYLEKFLPDATLRRFVQKALGYCLLGTNEQRLALFLFGGTSTGKSTMLNAVMSALGGYAETVDLSIFKEKASGLNPALAQAMPRRIITSSEAGMQNHMHADLFKRMTGNDRISAELKGVNVIVTRIPAFTPIIATNTPPTIKGADAALQKRLLILPFNTQVSEDEDQKSAGLAMDEISRPAILSWLVDGWAMYAREGLPKKEWPGAVLDTTKEFGGQLNDLGEFLVDATIDVPAYEATSDGQSTAFVTLRDMYDAYTQWCVYQKIGEREMYSMNMFGRQLKQMGIEQKVIKVEGKPVRVWLGRKLIDSGIKIKTLKST